MKAYIIIFIFTIFKSISSDTTSNILIIPFQLKEPQLPSQTNTSLILNTFFTQYYTTEINIGSPLQKTSSIISINCHAFLLSEKYCSIFENKSQKGFITSLSSSYKPIEKITSYLNEYNESEIFQDIILQNNKTYEIQMLNGEYNTNNEKCGCLGTGDSSTHLYKAPPQFFEYLKEKKYIDSENWSIKFSSNKKDGQLIIGALPHEYDNKTYDEELFYKTKTESLISFSKPWSFKMQKTFFENYTQCIIIENDSNFYLEYEYGFIIGSAEYKKFINDIYFNYLIEDNICSLEIANIINSSSETYSIYICNKDKIKSKDKLKKFPDLNFYNIDYNYTFVLNYEDLFKEVNDKVYFMIIFPVTTSKSWNWRLGLPFLKKYQFVLNYDSKTIGFYIPKESEDNSKNDDKKEGNSNFVIYICLSLIFCIFIVIAYFLGKKLNEKKKKRANELKDDDYEYMPEGDGKENKSNSKIGNLGV